jgi:pimeloyl-ACP methyl ester carboxylesterase
VISVHGGAQGSNFSAQRALADRGWQLVVPDRPGHGRSPDPGRPRIAAEVRELICRFTAENAWGARKIHAELEKLGVTVGLATVSRSLAKRLAVRQKPQ